MPSLETRPNESFRSGTSRMGEFLGRHIKMSNSSVLYCTKGEADITIDLKQYHITPHTNITLLTGSVVSLLTADKDFEVHYFSFSEEMLKATSFRLQPSFIYFLKKNPCHTHTDKATLSSINGMITASNTIYTDKENHFRDAIAQNLLQIFFLDTYDKVRRLLASEQSNGNNRKEELFKQFINLVHTHCTEQREVSYYADQLCISTRYLSDITRQMGEHSAKEIINNMLILELKVALQSTTLSLKEIADKFHFPDQSFFGRYFKQHTGMSPKKFRMMKE